MSFKKNNYVYSFLVILILCIGALVRFYKIGVVPYGFSWDEASIIYNSWSLSAWYRDENATFLPLVFRSFGDYKPPFVFYWMAWQYFLTNINPLLLRINAALFGMGSVIVVYLFSKELIKKILEDKNANTKLSLFNDQRLSKVFSLMTLLLMAISPWAIQFSRLGFEQGFAFFWVNLSMLLLLKGLKKPKWYVLTAIFISLSLYSFHTARVFWVLMIPFFGLLFLTEIRKGLRYLMWGVVLLFLTLIPLFYSILFQDALARASSLVIFNDQDNLRSATSLLIELGNNLRNQLSLDYWLKGRDEVSIRHMVPNHGVFYVVSFGMMILGLIYGFIKRNKYFWLIVSWFVAGMMPALISNKTPHALRSLFVLSPAVLLASLGFVAGYMWLKGKGRWLSRFVVAGLVIILLFEFGLYVKSYFGEYAIASAVDHQYGYQQVIEYLSNPENEQENVVMTDKLGQPYIYFLMYKVIPAQEYLWGGLNAYEFRSIDWPEEVDGRIYIGTPDEIPITDQRVNKVIYVPNSDVPALVIAK